MFILGYDVLMAKTVKTHCAYDIYLPQTIETAVVFASPHSGRAYSDRFLAQTILDPHTLRSSEDAFVDQLIDYVTDFGAPLICAKAPRAFLDLNRAHDELDPAVVEGVKVAGHNARIASGLGVIPRVVAHGRPIYRGKMSLTAAHARIETFWRPYHAALDDLIAQTRAKFGFAVLIDMHSMPHDAVASPAKSVPSTQIVLGDRYGASAGRDISDFVHAALTTAGFRVARNIPFAGAYIVGQYGRPSQNQHALQIEIDRSLYLDETAISPNQNFDTTRGQLRQALKKITDLGRDVRDLAAE